MDGHPRVRLADLDAFLFDLDGVVTDTAAVHAAAWKELFDGFLTTWSRRTGTPFRPFDLDRDYRQYVDGKRRYDGVRDFLASRDIRLPEGDPSDSTDAETVAGLGNRKDESFRVRLERDGVEAFPSSVNLIHRLIAAGKRIGMISSSRNCVPVLRAAGIEPLFEVIVDGVEQARLGLPGKPDPAVFLEAAHRLGVVPERSAVFEDAISGVQAGRAGGFAVVVGVDRVRDPAALRDAGADLVVPDLAELHVEGLR